MGRRPNVLWIMTDQHRADALGCTGGGAVLTPHLDRLAASGVLFENAFCQTPACMASRASVFTGRYPAAVRVRGMGILPPRETTTPEVFRRNGYRTGAFGKVHLTPEQYTLRVLGRDVPTLDLSLFAEAACLDPLPDDPLKKNYGFEEHAGCEDCLQGLFKAWLAKERPDLAPGPGAPAPGGPGDCWVSPLPSEFHQSTFIARQAESFIRRRAGGGPWFAFCSFIAPHHPFEAPADQIARYDIGRIPLPPGAPPAAEQALIPEPARSAFTHTDGWTEEGMRRVILHYHASVSLIDDNVGRLLAALDETGQTDDTLVVFVADHGEFLGRHGLVRKPSLHYDDTLRVPLILRLPGGRSGGRRVRGLVELTDVHPTLLSLAGLETNPGCQGRDWSDAILAGTPIGREDIFSDMYDDPFNPAKCAMVGGGPYAASQTIRTERWKLSIYPTAGPAFGQLFDLARDPGEERNLYGDPAFKTEREELLWRLAARLIANVDPLPRVLSQW